MKISVVFLTARAEPELPWMLRGLAKQLQSGDEIDLVVVDAFGRELDQLGVHWLPSGVTATVVEPPNGRGAWAKASAANAALAIVERDYVAFVDDRCVLGTAWLDAVRCGEAERASVVAGAYVRVADGVVELDHRLALAPDGRVDCGGGWLYGCAFALPLAWLLEVNGFEEGCDGIGGEDVILGAVLENGGRRVDFVPRMLVWLERSSWMNHGLTKRDKEIGEATVARYGAGWRTTRVPDLRAVRAGRHYDRTSPHFAR